MSLRDFIHGASSAIVDEYDRQHKVNYDVAKEERAEQRAVAAEARRLAAEKMAADYRERVRREGLQWQTEYETGLIQKGADPSLLRDDAKARQEAARISEGVDPTLRREEQRDIEEAARIRAGSITDPEQARIEARVPESLAEQEAAGRAAAKRKDDIERAARGLPPSNSAEVTFSVAEASSALDSALRDEYNIDLKGIRNRLSAKGEGSVVSALRSDDYKLGEVLADPDYRNALREEIILKGYSMASREIKNAANKKQIADLNVVTQVADGVLRKADQVLTMLDTAYEMSQDPNQDPAAISDMLYDALKTSYGQPDDEAKQDTGFRSFWKSVNRHIAPQSK